METGSPFLFEIRKHRPSIRRERLPDLCRPCRAPSMPTIRPGSACPGSVPLKRLCSPCPPVCPEIHCGPAPLASKGAASPRPLPAPGRSGPHAAQPPTWRPGSASAPPSSARQRRPAPRPAWPEPASAFPRMFPETAGFSRKSETLRWRSRGAFVPRTAEGCSRRGLFLCVASQDGSGWVWSRSGLCGQRPAGHFVCSGPGILGPNKRQTTSRGRGEQGKQREQ